METSQLWMCPYCEWKTGICRDGSPDIGLVTNHVFKEHEETEVYPRSLIRRTHRQLWVCPFCVSPPWFMTWEYDYSGEDPDVGLMIGEHMDVKHNEKMHFGYIPQAERRRQLAGVL